MGLIMSTSPYVLRFKDFLKDKLPAVLSLKLNLFDHVTPAYATINLFTKDMAIEVLCDKGHTRRDAELIVNSIEEWGFELEQVEYLNFEVHGESVWMNPE